MEECQATSTVSYFWYRQTLNVTAAIEHGGSVQWRLLACLAACWAVVYLCVIRGIESTGKVRVRGRPHTSAPAAAEAPGGHQCLQRSLQGLPGRAWAAGGGVSGRVDTFATRKGPS